VIKSPIDVDEVLKKMASESVKQGENIRDTIRDLTLKALQARELSLDQIRSVLASITQGVNLGVHQVGKDGEVVVVDDGKYPLSQRRELGFDMLANAVDVGLAPHCKTLQVDEEPVSTAVVREALFHGQRQQLGTQVHRLWTENARVQ
jgi:hypothetical protein